MRRHWFALCVVAPLAVSCSDSTVETVAPSSTDGQSETSTSTTIAPPTSTRSPSTTPALTTTQAAGPAAPLDVVPGTPGWFLTAGDEGVHLLRPDGKQVALLAGAVTNAVAGDGTTIYFQRPNDTGISVLDLRTGVTKVAVAAAATGEALVLHGMAVGNRGPLPAERWLYYERVANGERRLVRWRPETAETAELGVLASASDRIERISYARGSDFLMIVERGGRRELKAIGWDGEPRKLEVCGMVCHPVPCDPAVARCEHLAVGSLGSMAWIETIGDRQELVVGSASESPGAVPQRRIALPAGTVVAEIRLDPSNIIVNTRDRSSAGRALLLFGTAGHHVPVAARVLARVDDLFIPLPTDAANEYAFRRGDQLWLQGRDGTVRVLDDGPVRTVRAGLGRTVYFEREVPAPPVPLGGRPHVEIWRVDVDSGAKNLVVPAPTSDLDRHALVLVADIDGRARLLYTQIEQAPDGRHENARAVLFHTSLDGADAPVRVKAISGFESGMILSSVASGMFVGTQTGIQSIAPATFGVHGEPPTDALVKALRCEHVCDGSYGPSCAPGFLGCRFGFSIAPDGTRLAWIESAYESTPKGATRNGTAVAGHDLVVVDAATGAELQRAFIPVPTNDAFGSATWLTGDRLLLNLDRSLVAPAPSGFVSMTMVAQINGDAIEFRQVMATGPERGELQAIGR